MRPKGLLAVTIIMAILNLTPFVSTRRFRFFAATLVVEIFVALTSYAILWFFWKGKNWARLCVLAMSVISILNFFALLYPKGNVFVFDSIVIGWGVVGLYLMYWLNLSDVKLWFKNQANRPANSSGS